MRVMYRLELIADTRFQRAAPDAERSPSLSFLQPLFPRAVVGFERRKSNEDITETLETAALWREQVNRMAWRSVGVELNLVTTAEGRSGSEVEGARAEWSPAGKEKKEHASDSSSDASSPIPRKNDAKDATAMTARCAIPRGRGNYPAASAAVVPTRLAARTSQRGDRVGA